MFDSHLNDLLSFVHERDWGQFHSPKNLAIAFFVEVSELLEICLESRQNIEHVKEELGDICNCLLLVKSKLKLFIPSPLSIIAEIEHISTTQSMMIKLVVDAGRFVEHFQWLTTEESYQLYLDKDRFFAIQKSFEKIWIDLFRLARILHLDLELLAQEKLKKTALKYPSSIFKGRSILYHKLYRQ